MSLRAYTKNCYNFDFLNYFCFWSKGTKIEGGLGLKDMLSDADVWKIGSVSGREKKSPNSHHWVETLIAPRRGRSNFLCMLESNILMCFILQESTSFKKSCTSLSRIRKITGYFTEFPMTSGNSELYILSKTVINWTCSFPLFWITSIVALIKKTFHIKNNLMLLRQTELQS